MADVAQLIADMVREGVSAEIVGRVAAALAEREAILIPDAKAEQRRTKDRERKRHVRGIPQNSAESADPPFPSSQVSPTPPSNPTTLSPNPPIVPPAPKAFERFWAEYPRKVGKGAARTAFERAVKKIPDADPVGFIIAQLRRQRPTMTEPKFTPHPATWLNEERWLDEPDVVAADVRVQTWDRDVWSAAVANFREAGRWADAMGPPPGEPNCRAPPEALAEHGYSRIVPFERRTA